MCSSQHGSYRGERWRHLDVLLHTVVYLDVLQRDHKTCMTSCGKVTTCKLNLQSGRIPTDARYHIWLPWHKCNGLVCCTSWMWSKRSTHIFQHLKRSTMYLAMRVWQPLKWQEMVGPLDGFGSIALLRNKLTRLRLINLYNSASHVWNKITLSTYACLFFSRPVKQARRNASRLI